MKFRMFADSVHGKKYFERGLPCQDFSATMEFDGVQVIAVADGHGGKDYFRSDTGARLAVEVAFAQAKKFCSDISADETFSVNGIKNFEHAVWNAWREAVMNHWRENPVTEDEFRWQTVSDKYKARFTSTDEKILAKYIPVAYGTTLICAISIGTQVLITQIGDGTCVVLHRDGEFKVAVPPDSENFLNVTTSLCDENAFGKFRDNILNCDESPRSPVAIFLSTDGLDDCYLNFENEKYLYKLYSDTVIDSLITNGFELTNKALHEELLPYMTERGSNDDISLAYLVTEDLNLLKAAVEKISTPVDTVTEKVSTPVDTVTEKISTPVDNVAEEVSTPVDNVTEKVSTPVNNVTEKISTPVDTVTEEVSTSVATVTEKVSTLVDTVTEEVSTPTDNVTEKILPTPLFPIPPEEISPPVATVTEKMSPTPLVNIEPQNFMPQKNSSPVIRKENVTWLPPVKIESNVNRQLTERSNGHEQP